MVRNSLGLALGVILSLFSTSSIATQELAKQKNCMSCHDVSRKLVGPSFESIAEKYGNKNASAKLAGKIVRGGSGTWGAIPMPPHPQLTPEETQALVQWMMGLR